MMIIGSVNVTVSAVACCSSNRAIVVRQKSLFIFSSPKQEKNYIYLQAKSQNRFRLMRDINLKKGLKSRVVSLNRGRYMMLQMTD